MIGELELAPAPAHRARKRALLMPEELALDQGVRNGGTVDLDEGGACTSALPVNFPRHELFSGTVLPGNENRRIGFGALVNDAANPLQLRTTADHLLARLQRVPQLPVLPTEFLQLKCVAHEGYDLFEAQRLFQEVEGTHLHSFYGDIDTAVT